MAVLCQSLHRCHLCSFVASVNRPLSSHAWIKPGVRRRTTNLDRVAALVSAAVDAGGTHLVVPRSEACWLSDHAHVVEYLTTRHWLADANAELGFIFALRDSSLDQRDRVGAAGDEHRDD